MSHYRKEAVDVGAKVEVDYVAVLQKSAARKGDAFEDLRVFLVCFAGIFLKHCSTI